MNCKQRAIFSNNAEYFAAVTNEGILKIWETSSNTLKQEHVLNSDNSTCSTLIWSKQPEINGFDGMNRTDDAREKKLQLVIGFEEGRILTYSLLKNKFQRNFVKIHTDVVKDLCWSSEANSFFSCSKDRKIILWDISSRDAKLQWEADDPLSSICVIDSDNLLAAGTSITWWNIQNQTVLKKFERYGNEITFLLPVISTDVSSKSYFLSHATGESEIIAWDLRKKNSKNSVAVFDLSDSLENMDVTKYFSKTQPMYMSAVVKDGSMLLFKHVLNGKASTTLSPETTLKVMSKGKQNDSSVIAIMASRFTDAESCIIAYGSEENLIFETVKVEDCPKTMVLSREIPSCQNTSTDISDVPNSILKKRKRSLIKENKKAIKIAENSHEVRNEASTSEEQIGNIEVPNWILKKRKRSLLKKSEKAIKIAKASTSEEPIGNIESVLRNPRQDDLRNFSKDISSHELISTLTKVHGELSNNNSSGPRNLLKFILTENFGYLRTNTETFSRVLHPIQEYLDSKQIKESVAKIHRISGLLSMFRLQKASHEEENKSSQNEEPMES